MNVEELSDSARKSLYSKEKYSMSPSRYVDISSSNDGDEIDDYNPQAPIICLDVKISSDRTE